MASSLRRDVLKAFKSLHRARTTVFKGDDHALSVTRNEINKEFQKNKNVENEEVIQEMIKFSKEVETELLTTVVQARRTESGKYEVDIREETLKMDNFPYQDVPEEVLLATKKSSKKCSDKPD